MKINTPTRKAVSVKNILLFALLSGCTTVTSEPDVGASAKYLHTMLPENSKVIIQLEYPNSRTCRLYKKTFLQNADSIDLDFRCSEADVSFYLPYEMEYLHRQYNLLIKYNSITMEDCLATTDSFNAKEVKNNVEVLQECHHTE